MRTAALIMALALAAEAPAIAQEGGKASSATSRTGHLKCGDARLTASTHYLDLPDHDRQVLTQTLELTGPDGRTKKLDHDGRAIRQPFLKETQVLDASVTGWACLEGSGGNHFVYVLYTCAESPVRPHCTGAMREWVRLFDTAGTPLNARYPRSGSPTPLLMKKLGLARYLEGGVRLVDVTE